MLNLDALAEMESHAKDAAKLMKELSNEYRLMILCALASEELSVGQINELMPLSQSAISQHLARLRESKLVATRREAQTIYYRLNGDAAIRVIEVLHSIYCPSLNPLS